jgi:hypothetical protein
MVQELDGDGILVLFPPSLSTYIKTVLVDLFLQSDGAGVGSFENKK